MASLYTVAEQLSKEIVGDPLAGKVTEIFPGATTVAGDPAEPAAEGATADVADEAEGGASGVTDWSGDEEEEEEEWKEEEEEKVTSIREGEGRESLKGRYRY